MQAGAGFEVASEPLKALLDELHDGLIQVPEFQRAVVLKDGWVKSLLASVSLGYPVGAVMLLEADDHYARFATHPVRGAPALADGGRPERLLVDGQHRLAALYQALRAGGSVSMQDEEGRAAERSYYIDMRVAVDPGVDRDEAIFSVGEGVDFDAPESDRDGWLFPLGLVFGGDAERMANAERAAVLAPELRWASFRRRTERGQSPANTDGPGRERWVADFVGRGTAGDEERAALVRQFEVEVLSAFEEYMVPAILFPKEWTRWTVRMRGGANGRALSDELGIPRRDEVQ